MLQEAKKAGIWPKFILLSALEILHGRLPPFLDDDLYSTLKTKIDCETNKFLPNSVEKKTSVLQLPACDGMKRYSNSNSIEIKEESSVPLSSDVGDLKDDETKTKSLFADIDASASVKLKATGSRVSISSQGTQTADNYSSILSINQENQIKASLQSNVVDPSLIDSSNNKNINKLLDINPVSCTQQSPCTEEPSKPVSVIVKKGNSHRRKSTQTSFGGKSVKVQTENNVSNALVQASIAVCNSSSQTKLHGLNNRIIYERKKFTCQKEVQTLLVHTREKECQTYKRNKHYQLISIDGIVERPKRAPYPSSVDGIQMFYGKPLKHGSDDAPVNIPMHMEEIFWAVSDPRLQVDFYEF